jgi:hypothetical protein
MTQVLQLLTGFEAARFGQTAVIMIIAGFKGCGTAAMDHNRIDPAGLEVTPVVVAPPGSAASYHCRWLA